MEHLKRKKIQAQVIEINNLAYIDMEEKEFADMARGMIDEINHHIQQIEILIEDEQ